MELTETGSGRNWAPAQCTLPAAERPLRAAEFDELFAAAVRGVERTGPTRLRLDLLPSRPVAARTAELMLAESACCSFFAFALTAADGRLGLEVTVPVSHAEALNGLATRAAAASAPPESAPAESGPAAFGPTGPGPTGSGPAGSGRATSGPAGASPAESGSGRSGTAPAGMGK